MAEEKPVESETTKTADSEHVGIMGLIGEVLSVLGIIIFILMLITPLFRELLGENLWAAIKAVGWLSTTGALTLGFLFSLFTRGKFFYKMMLLFLVLISAIFYIGIVSNGAFLTSVTSYLDPLLTFYR